MLLSRMAEAGELKRMAHGVYATPEASATRLAETRALWLSLDPTRTAEERQSDLPTSGVISHESAALLHGAGTLRAGALHVTLPRRYRTARPELRTHTARLAPDEVELVDGLPVTTLARTVKDLLADRTDLAHVADVVVAGRYAAVPADVAIDAAAPVPARLEYTGAIATQLAEPMRAYRKLLATNPTILATSEEAHRLGEHLDELLKVPALDKPPAAALRIPLPPGLSDQTAQITDRLNTSMSTSRQARVSWT
jgi:hypothetical protein